MGLGTRPYDQAYLWMLLSALPHCAPNGSDHSGQLAIHSLLLLGRAPLAATRVFVRHFNTIYRRSPCVKR